LFLVHRFWFVTDDAYISFRYARNLAMGHGLRFNLGEHTPVEGYSNFLWVLLTSVFECFRLNVTSWVPLTSTLCGVVLLFLVYDLLRRRWKLSLPVVCATTLFLGFYPPFGLWSSSGLATMPFALLTFVAFERLVLRERGPDAIGGAAAGLLLALIRVEGVAWFAVIWLLASISHHLAGRKVLKPWLACGLIVGLGFGAYYAWRYTYYGEPLPNTAYAKGTLTVPLLMRGVDYLTVYVLTLLTPLVVVPGTWAALRRRRIAVGLPTAAIAWAFAAYSILVTGDFMAMGRFMVPGLAFNAILLAWMLDDLKGTSRARTHVATALGAILIVIGALPGWDMHLVPSSVRARFQFRHNHPTFRSEYAQWLFQCDNGIAWRERGRALKLYASQRLGPDPSLVSGPIGAIGYYGELFIYDKTGLVTPTVAKRAVGPDERIRSPGHDKRVDSTFFLEHQPTLLEAVVVRETDHAQVADRIMAWAAHLRRSGTVLHLTYVPDFAELPRRRELEQRAYVCVIRRIPSSESWQQAWDRLDSQLQRFRQKGQAPQLTTAD
jgi:hypothetical protein